MEEALYQDKWLQDIKYEQKMIQKMKARKEKQKKLTQEIGEGQAYLDEEVVFERHYFFNGFMSLMVPKTFKQYTEDKDYCMCRPDSMDLHIVLSHFPKGAQIESLKDCKEKIIEAMFKEAGAGVDWKEEGIYKIGEQNVYYFAFRTPVEESFIDHFIFLTSKGERSVIINFACMEDRFEAWEGVGKALMENMTVC